MHIDLNIHIRALPCPAHAQALTSYISANTRCARFTASTLAQLTRLRHHEKKNNILCRDSTFQRLKCKTDALTTEPRGR